jgi:hypothetical protein
MIGNTMKKHYKDYELVTKELSDGKIKQVAEYRGKFYICMLSSKKLSRVKLYLLALVLCSGATVMGAGFLNTPSSRVAYVALPYVSLFLPIAYSIMGTVGFIKSSNKLKHAEYLETKVRIFRSSIWQIVLSSLTLIGEICFILFKAKQEILKETIFVSLMVLIITLNIISLQLQKRVVYQVEDPDYNG